MGLRFIPNPTLKTTNGNADTKVTSELYDDLRSLIQNDQAIVNVMNNTTILVPNIVFRNCASCSGSCTTTCTAVCISNCGGNCTGTCKSFCVDFCKSTCNASNN